MQISFNIDEFVAYLLNGGLLLGSMLQLFDGDLNFFSFNENPTNPQLNQIIGIIMLIAIVFIAGHASSLFSRYITRHLLWLFTGRPREHPFTRSNDRFWPNDLGKQIQELVQIRFDLQENIVTDIFLRKVAPRLIRAHVLENSQSFNEIRNRMVRARSLCANSVLPLLIFAIDRCLNSEYILSIALTIAAILMLSKQHDLDVREWKEVYLRFIANLTSDNLQGK